MFKRVLDVVVSVAVLVLLAPLLFALAIIIRWRMGSPVLFRQERPGRHGKPFMIIKFRTMSDALDEEGHLLAESKRVTKLGHFLRSSSLDELPELWNVIRGEMSLVGPRPLRTVYLERYSAHHARRHEVRPGITGWAQVNGRNRVDWDDRLDMDVWYVDHRSFWLDLKILTRTVKPVLRRDGQLPMNNPSMEPFRISRIAKRDSDTS